MEMLENKISAKSLALIDRETGKLIGPMVPFKSGESFYKIPNLDSKIWHYMDYWKFECLINQKCLYFCRSDKLEDWRENMPRLIVIIQRQCINASLKYIKYKTAIKIEKKATKIFDTRPISIAGI
jgi:hypothetical protein